MFDKKILSLLASGTSGTWKELGVHYNTLGALVKRGLMAKSDSSGIYSVLPKGRMLATIIDLAADYEYITLQKVSAPLGMMCSIKGYDILDAWDNIWDWGDEDLWFDDYRHSRTKILVKREIEKL